MRDFFHKNFSFIIFVLIFLGLRFSNFFSYKFLFYPLIFLSLWGFYKKNFLSLLSLPVVASIYIKFWEKANLKKLEFFENRNGVYEVKILYGRIGVIREIRSKFAIYKISSRVGLKTKPLSRGYVLIIEGILKKSKNLYYKGNGALYVIEPKKIKYGWQEKTLWHFFENRLKKLYKDTISLHLLEAIILGERKALPFFIRNLYYKTGTMHLLAISGLHIGIIWLIVNSFFKIIGFSYFPSLIFSLFFIFGYLLVIGFIPSVFRAVLFAFAFVISEFFARKRQFLNILGAVGVICLLLFPYWVYSISFLLSFGATMGIILFVNFVEKESWMPDFFYKYIWLPFWVSIFAQIFTFPIVLKIFGFFPSSVFFSNILLIPFSFIIITEAFLSIIFSFISFKIALPFAKFCELLINLKIFLMKKLSSFKVIYLSFSESFTYLWFLFVIIILFVLNYLRCKEAGGK